MKSKAAVARGAGKPLSIEEIQVEGISQVGEVGLPAVGAVVIVLQLEIVSLAKYPRPAPQNISSGKQSGFIEGLGIWKRVSRRRRALARTLVV